jgi:hypothetical protein
MEEASTGECVFKKRLINAVEMYCPDHNCWTAAASTCASKVCLSGAAEGWTLWTDLAQAKRDNTSTNGMTNNKR